MFIENLLKASAIEVRSARISREISRYTDHGMFTVLRMRLAVLKKLHEADISKLTKEEYRRFFPMSTLLIHDTIRTAAEIEDEKEQAKKERAAQAEARKSRNRGKAEVAEAVVTATKTKTASEMKDEKRTQWLPSEREVIASSDLWGAIMLAMENVGYMEYHMVEHVKERIYNTLNISISRKDDNDLIEDIATIIATALVMR